MHHSPYTVRMPDLELRREASIRIEFVVETVIIVEDFLTTSKLEALGVHTSRSEVNDVELSQAIR